MIQLKKTYRKYRNEFKKLEKYCAAFSGAANPFEYENWVAVGSACDRDEQNIYGGEWSEDQKEAHRMYWNQRDKVNQLLLDDNEFQKFASKKPYIDGQSGLDAFFWISFSAIKHKIYPVK